MKRILFILLIINILLPISAQVSNSTSSTHKSWFDKSEITFGGALGATFGNSYTAVQIAPQIGYNFTKNLNAGLGFQYAHYAYKNNETNYSQNYFGMNIYGRVTIANYFMILVQPEINRVWWSNKKYNTNGTKLVPALLVGAGVRLGNVFMMLEYDAVQNEYSPYGQSIFYAVGVVF